MRLEEVRQQFTYAERGIIRGARRKTRAECDDTELALLRSYQRLLKQRQRAGLTKQEDGRKNQLFNEWLKQNKFSYADRREYQTLYKQFRRELDRV